MCLTSLNLAKLMNADVSRHQSSNIIIVEERELCSLSFCKQEALMTHWSRALVKGTGQHCSMEIVSVKPYFIQHICLHDR